MAEIRLGRARGTAGQRAVPVLAVAVVVALFVFLPDLRSVLQVTLARLLAPAQLGTTQALTATGEFFGTVGQAGDLAAQNRAYQEQVRQLQATLAQKQELEAENHDLRSLLGLRDRLPSGSVIPAQVIARDPLAQVQAVVIDRGSEDGLVPNLPIVTDRGVAGRIVEVYRTSAKALLLADVSSAIAVRSQGPESQATGLVRGTGDGRLILQYVAQDEVLRIGDSVSTSGTGGAFPPGLAIGTISQIRQTDVGVFQEALVEPTVRARNLERVYVLTKWPDPKSS